MPLKPPCNPSHLHSCRCSRQISPQRDLDLVLDRWIRFVLSSTPKVTEPYSVKIAEKAHVLHPALQMLPSLRPQLRTARPAGDRLRATADTSNLRGQVKLHASRRPLSSSELLQGSSVADDGTQATKGRILLLWSGQSGRPDSRSTRLPHQPDTNSLDTAAAAVTGAGTTLTAPTALQSAEADFPVGHFKVRTFHQPQSLPRMAASLAERVVRQVVGSECLHTRRTADASLSVSISNGMPGHSRARCLIIITWSAGDDQRQTLDRWRASIQCWWL